MAEQKGLDVIPEFLREVFYPAALGTFRDTMPSGELTVFLHTGPGAAQKEITLKNMFPFMTLQDIKVALFVELKKADEALPPFIHLCIHGSEPGKKFLGGKTAPIDYTWNMPSIAPGTSFYNAPPFDLAAGSKPLDGRFVDSNGERKLVSLVNRERITIEDAFFKHGIAKGIPEFHAYLYRDLLAVIPGAKPPSEKDWNGRLYPLFPFLGPTVQATPELKAKAERLAVAFTRRQQFLMRLESLLEENVPLIPLSLAGIKFLRLTWPKKKGIPGIEAQFYEASVNARRPFMRLIPTEGSGISKVFLADGKTPDIQDPKMLVSWSQERNPTPEQDYAFAKILIRKGLMNLPPIYATLRLFNDGSADCIVEPPKGMKKLEPRTDLTSFGESLIEGLKELPYINSLPDIGNAVMVLGIRLKKEDAQLTQRVLRERLPVFTSFFQEIAALPGEKPLLMLRFKLVSNFATEDRIQTFLTQVINRKVLRGEGLVSNLVELVADEFQMDMVEARKQVATKLQAQSDVALVNPESKDYMLQYNPGIDVGIFAQHPFYTFHIHRVDSLENLQRVVTALSLMISAEVADLHVSAKAVRELRTAEGLAEVVPEAPAAEEAKEAEAEAEQSPAAAPPEEAEDVGGAEEMPDYLDFFAYEQPEDENKEMTLEEAHAAEAVAAQQGTPYPEPPAPGEKPAAPPAAAAAPVEQLKEQLAKGVAAPKEDMAGVKPVEKDSDDEEGPAGTEGGIANFFLNKLKEADPRLFDYTKKHPSLKRYVSKCQPTHGRQPAVLNEAQFQRMREEYAGDNVFFQIFPLQEGDPEKPPGAVEKDYYTVLRFGTAPQNQNYYLCCRYFCTKDEIMVREADLESTQMRRPKGAPKRPGECPFCKGKVIGNRRAPKPGETIMEREIKPKTDSRHLFISFLKTTPHPEGFYLPCCFLKEEPIQFRDKEFDKVREWAAPPKPAAVKPASREAAAALREDEEDAKERRAAVGPRQEVGIPITDYQVLLAGVTTKYIIGSEKLPLEVGMIDKGKYAAAQVGLLPPALDPYFNQDSTELVSRTFNPQKIKDGATGFLRVGVENRHRFQGDSFLAAIAPFYLKNNAEQMKDFLLKKITPRVFLALNYGNLALEFYDPANSVVKRLTDAELSTWASDELPEVDLQEENQEALQRAYLSYTTFEAWMNSDNTKKEYRHFALALSQSNLIREGIGPGTTFIVLDVLKNGKMAVRCPPYGYNAELMSGNNIAFLMRHWSGIWEPIFFVDNRPPEERGVDIYTLKFQMAAAAQWPPIVRQRLQEFMNQCSSSGRAVYTSQSKINPLAMIPSSVANRILRKDTHITFEAVLRDSYNHLAALLFKDKAHPGAGYIALPVVDDGELMVSKNLIMDWDDPDYKRAPVDIVLHFYKTFVEKRFALYPGFSPVRLVKSRRSGVLEAVQLRNGLYVPVGPPTEAAAEEMEKLPSVTVDEMEWSINHEICLEEKATEVPGEQSRMKMIEFQEVFEHLRLTFSNWLATLEDGGEFRETLEGVIFARKLPLFEKRKRLESLLGREVGKWITTDFADEDKKKRQDASLLRVDCRIRGQKACAGRCVWKQGTEEGRCMLHVPKETELGEGEKKVSAPRVLLLRLIEELLRYGERRRQLLEQDVNRLAVLEKPVTIDGNQRIYPEKSAAWFELLRLEWATKLEEVPKFNEEMSKDAAEEPAPAVAEQKEETALTPSMELILNGGPEPDPKTGALRLFRAPFEALLVPLGLTPAQLSIRADTTALTDEMIRAIVTAKGVPVIQINASVDPPTVIAKKPTRPAATGVPVFLITTEGPALLMKNPASPEFLKRDEMPRGLLHELDRAKGVLGLKKPGM